MMQTTNSWNQSEIRNASQHTVHLSLLCIHCGAFRVTILNIMFCTYLCVVADVVQLYVLCLANKSARHSPYDRQLFSTFVYLICIRYYSFFLSIFLEKYFWRHDRIESIRRFYYLNTMEWINDWY